MMTNFIKVCIEMQEMKNSVVYCVCINIRNIYNVKTIDGWKKRLNYGIG